MGNPISGSIIIEKDVVLQVGIDLRDPCIKIGLSFWILHAEIHEISRDAYDP
jgi:exosome complex RNA-binding protein Rrp42 (RNase PH superfamily)